MPTLIRLDHTGHTTLASWKPGDAEALDAAVEAFRRELGRGYYAVVSEGTGRARQVHELPPDADLVILRRPIVGG